MATWVQESLIASGLSWGILLDFLASQCTMLVPVKQTCQSLMVALQVYAAHTAVVIAFHLS